MTVTTVFSTAASFLSFASARETSRVPKLEDLAWGSSATAIPLETTEDLKRRDISHIGSYIGNEHKDSYDTIVANYLIVGCAEGHFQGAYIAFSGRSNFDKVARTFLQRYGGPDKSGSASENHHWTGNDLNVRLHYQASTDEGILALTHQGA